MATGGSGHGFKFAPMLGDWIADAVEGRAQPAPGRSSAGGPRCARRAAKKPPASRRVAGQCHELSMVIARVVGTVVTTISHPHYKGRRLLVVQPLAMPGQPEDGDFLALDNTQAGIGDTVLVNREGNGRAPGAAEPRRCGDLASSWASCRIQMRTLSWPQLGSTFVPAGWLH